MPIARELLSRFEFTRNKKTPFPSITISINVLYCAKEVSQSQEPFRCIDIYNRKASDALWVHHRCPTVGPKLSMGCVLID